MQMHLAGRSPLLRAVHQWQCAHDMPVESYGAIGLPKNLTRSSCITSSSSDMCTACLKTCTLDTHATRKADPICDILLQLGHPIIYPVGCDRETHNCHLEELEGFNKAFCRVPCMHFTRRVTVDASMQRPPGLYGS